jgi:hypothetical protein
MVHDDVDARRARRADWPVRVVDRASPPPSGIDTTSEERIEMMWELAQQAWRLAGRAIPDYDRAHTPVRKVRRGDP